MMRHGRNLPCSGRRGSQRGAVSPGAGRRHPEVLDVPEAVEPLVEYFRSISGEHPDWDEYRQAMVRQGKSLLRITPVRWGPVATGGFPPRLALPDMSPLRPVNVGPGWQTAAYD